MLTQVLLANDTLRRIWPVVDWDGESPYTPPDYGLDSPDADIQAGRVRRFDGMDELIDDLDAN